MGHAGSRFQDVLHLIHDLFGAFERGTLGQLDVDEHHTLIRLGYESGRNLLKHVSCQHQEAAVDEQNKEAPAN